jgi:AcrR family transcriptional regulator
MLDAAARLFGVRRFHEVRMDDIAAEARVSKGTVYRYFRDKEELYLALLDRATAQVVARLRQSAAEAPTPRGRLTALVAALIDYFDTHPHLFDLIQRAEVLRRAEAAFPWQQARDEMLRLVFDIFEEGRRRGELDVPEPQLAALLLLGGVRSVVRFGSRPRPSRLAEQVIDTFLQGADTRSPS